MPTLTVHASADTGTPESVLRKELISLASTDNRLDFLAEGDYLLYYQPITALHHILDDDLPTVEALLRWQRFDNQVVIPAFFLPQLLAEDAGKAVTHYTISRAQKDLEFWNFRVRIAMNFSPAQLLSGDVIPILSQLPATTRHLLEIEITEHPVSDMKALRETVKKLKELGHTVWLDDVVADDVSTERIMALPVSGVKLDRSLVQRLTAAEGEDTRRVRAYVQTLRQLGLAITAEGISNPYQKSFMTSLSLDRLQGYFLGKPTRKELLKPLQLA